MRSVLFAVGDPRIPGTLADRFLYQSVGQVTTYDDVGDLLARKRPDALVIADDLQGSVSDLDQVLHGARQVTPELDIVVVVTRATGEKLASVELSTRDLGRIHVVRQQEGLEDEIGARLRLELGGTTRTCEITCWSPKGGVGKTTLNIALAEALARARPRTKIVVWDLDLYDADVADGMGLDQSSDNDLSGLIERGDFRPQTLKDAVYHHPSGIDVLAAPQSPIDANRYPLTPERFAAIRQALLYLGYEFIIYDLPVNLFLFKPAIDALRSCSAIFLVVTPDRFPLKAIGRVIPVLSNQALLDRCHFVINKNRQHGSFRLTPQDLHERFRGDIDTIAQVSPDPMLGDSQEARITVWEMDRDRTSKAARDIEDFARRVLRLAGKEVSASAENPRRGGLTDLFRKG